MNQWVGKLSQMIHWWDTIRHTIQNPHLSNYDLYGHQIVPDSGTSFCSDDWHQDPLHTGLEVFLGQVRPVLLHVGKYRGKLFTIDLVRSTVHDLYISIKDELCKG